MAIGDTVRRLRVRAGRNAVRALALAAVPCAAPCWSAPAQAPLAVLGKAKLFALGDSHRLRTSPLRLKYAKQEARVFGPDAAVSIGSTAAEDDLLTRLLAIRPDLRVLINSSVEDVAREKIALGFQFARAF